MGDIKNKMTNEEILKKAIEKAVKNGWEHNFKEEWIISGMKGSPDWYYNIIFSHDFAEALWGEEEICKDCGSRIDEKMTGARLNWKVIECSGCDCSNWISPKSKSTSLRKSDNFIIKAWQYHLQQMVLAEEQLQYLKKFL